MIKKQRGQDGVTITSLVIVIIVILILSGIAISQLSETSKIIDTAKSSTYAYKEETAREKVNLKITNLNVEKTGAATLQDLLDLKDTDPEITDVYRLGNNVILIMDNYQFEIDEELSIKSIEEYKEPAKSQIKQVKRRISVDKFDRDEEE